MIFGPKFACLVFSDTLLRVTTAKVTSKGLKIYYFAQKSLPAGVVFNSRITNLNLFKEAVKTFFLENYEQLKTRELVLGLNEQEYFLSSVSFKEKPKNLENAINDEVAKKIPFDLATAYLSVRQVSHLSYQIAAVPIETLQTLTGIFEEVGFSLKAIVPIPLVFPKIIGQPGNPYLFISSEEDLVYSLVINGTTIFTSTVSLKGELASFEKEVVKIAKEISAEESSNSESKIPLKDIFVLGTGADILKTFLSNQGFNTQIVSIPTLLPKKVRAQPTGFNRCLALSFYDSSVISFPKGSDSKTAVLKKTTSKKGVSWLKLFAIILLAAFLAASCFFFWPAIKDIFFKGPQDTNTNQSIKESTVSSKKNEATNGSKKQATPASQPKEVNKADFKIRILNGSGKSGVAIQARDFLAAKGYTVESTGNAANFDYKTTMVQIKDSKKEISKPLTNDLQERYSISIDLPLSEGELFDVLIIIGGD